ncbi:hypothetical protein Vadar_025012 [Vaccinium darrowii]|uniref:Uncharacterized protein n=1 Tax=Vaccinium darrowii TaxID=229202 RepID=A0ACB7YA64_9ERIC|nr:hypothetical protein Vadar_025012 [Vaccinium darrowii]
MRSPPAKRHLRDKRFLCFLGISLCIGFAFLVFGGHIVGAVHVGEGLEELDSGLAELFGHEDCGFCVEGREYNEGFVGFGCAVRSDGGGEREGP